MDPNLFFYSSSSESDDQYIVSLIRRKIRNTSDPLSLPNIEFEKRFRVTKEAFNYILEELEFVAQFSTAVPPKIQLATTLLLLASGGFQNTVGNDFLIGVGQSTLSKIIKRVVKGMERRLCAKYILFNPDDCDALKKNFEKFKIPGIIGCIGGTHFGLQKPTDEHMFLNKKGFHSLNSMIICDCKYKILAINSKYGGAVNDSVVWMQSKERVLLEQKYKNKDLRDAWLLGDSGYPLEPWLLTPYRSPQEGSMESRFNDVHSTARSIVKRTIGILKARWKILCHDKRSRYSPQKVAQFSKVCAALHNICIQFKVPNYEDVKNTPVEEPILDLDAENETQMTRIGKRIRDNIKNSLHPN